MAFFPHCYAADSQIFVPHKNSPPWKKVAYESFKFLDFSNRNLKMMASGTTGTFLLELGLFAQCTKQLSPT